MPVKELSDFARELDGAAKTVIVNEVNDMGISDVLRNAASIAYYVKKFGIKG